VAEVTADISQASKAGGLKTVIDIIVAPKDAFESLRPNPIWGWAFLAAFVLMIVGYFLQQPATQHASLGSMQHALATSPLYSTLTDEQKQRILARVAHPPAYQTALGIGGVVASLFVATLLNAVILLAASSLARGTGDFKHLFAGSMHIAVPSFGLYSLVLGIICRILGADHFATIADMGRAVPSLALVASGATGKLEAFLAGVQIFSLWGCGLNIVMMRTLAGVRNALAWLVPLLILIGAALLAATASGLYGG
jgi:Yip1 domain